LDSRLDIPFIVIDCKLIRVGKSWREALRAPQVKEIERSHFERGEVHVDRMHVEMKRAREHLVKYTGICHY
jgi:hypothetical protein